MENHLQDKDVVVTGASGGLGVAVVDELLGRGARVFAPCFEAEVPEALRERDVSAVAGVDLGDEGAVADYFASLPAIWGSVHLVGGFSMGPIESTSVDDVQKMWSMNALTCFLCCKSAIAAIRRAGGGGRIVNVSARPALEAAAGMSAYSMSKAAVASLTQGLAKEVAGDGITVNAIIPSIIDTAANRAAMPGADHESWPKPAELAFAIAQLVHPQAGLTSGSLAPLFGKTL